ncbi:uncharacterized protein LOC118744289 [Rhagoletis pomonella]|uniref:uncharacterized protein LOC118744289 n=1 Tax=Rhagoletis pomonella TaxID=28610 RepID=UPI001785D598|nr:uncharacterized protein LOC118744289 [Rhagoletis pomonella]
MENNEITMFMDVKLDIHNKRPESLKFKQWSRCEVKIEGIKCLPSYLRATISGCNDAEASVAEEERADPKRYISVSIIVPGVSISLAASRTKEFSYGLFWTQNRKQCYIYFALETDTSCRRHMKWIKKTIKNLELHRQFMLEQNRISRGPSMGAAGVHIMQFEKENKQINSQSKQENGNLSEAPYSTLGPLPNIPNCLDSNQSNWSRRVSHSSEIYEEIFENIDGQPRLSRRVSRASIASGIYEEMKPSANAFNVIDEESTESQPASGTTTAPPPLPPLPPPRKRINTFDGQGVLGEIPRSNTNPESELAKKKKYKNVLDNIFGSGRAKRAESVSETQACTAEDIINSITPTKPVKDNEITTPIYANDSAVKRQKNTKYSTLAAAKRNSFSSPDLSKINYVDTFDEKDIAVGSLNNSIACSDGVDLSTDSLHNACIMPSKENLQSSIFHGRISTDNLNVSEKIPNNFNFSAINSSGINLIGSNGAAIPTSNQRKNKILIDDLTGYCVMAPIRPKQVLPTGTERVPAEPTSSGYSTSSNPSTSSSSAEDPKASAAPKPPPVAAEESAIYEQMLDLHTSNSEQETTGNKSTIKTANDTNTLATSTASTSTSNIADFTGNLYENLLAVKASQELELQLPPTALSTSTPTESPHTQPTADNEKQLEEEENYYQTPRKSIISVDEKIPSYYPNSCDTAKTRRHHTLATASPQMAVYNTSPTVGATSTAAASTTERSSTASTSVGLRQLVTLKIPRERKDNLYISSPRSIIEQRQSGNYPPEIDNKNSQKNGRVQKSLRAGAMKIAEHVYTVKHAKHKGHNVDKNLNNNNETNVANFAEVMRDRLQTELLQIALLQKIDFKFDDAKSAADQQSPVGEQSTPSPTVKQQQLSSEKERIYENLLHHNLQLRQNENDVMTSSDGGPSLTPPAPTSVTNSKLEIHQSCMAGVSGVASIATADVVKVADSCSAVADGSGLGGGVKKFASLPRFKKIDFSPLRLRINNVLQRGQQQDF